MLVSRFGDHAIWMLDHQEKVEMEVRGMKQPWHLQHCTQRAFVMMDRVRSHRERHGQQQRATLLVKAPNSRHTVGNCANLSGAPELGKKTSPCNLHDAWRPRHL